MTRALDPSAFPRGDMPGRGRGTAFSATPLACLVRHLAIAAGELIREGTLPEGDADRFVRAEARLRALADSLLGGEGPGPWSALMPAVATAGGAALPIAELLGGAWGRHRWHFPERGVDRELVEAAKELLTQLRWHLPD